MKLVVLLKGERISGNIWLLTFPEKTGLKGVYNITRYRLSKTCLIAHHKYVFPVKKKATHGETS